MNFALPALIVFVVLLPGFAFRSRLQLSEGTKVDYSPFGQVVVQSVIAAAGIHAILICLSGWIFEKEVRFDTIFRLVTAKTSDDDISVLHQSVGWVGAYFGVALIGAIGISSALQWTVKHWGLDKSTSRFSRYFRFKKAPWFYLFSGRDQPSSESPDLIQVAALVEIGGQPYLYQGILDEYFFDESGKLDRLVISAASRRPLADDSRSFRSEGRPSLGAKNEAPRAARKFEKPRFYPIIGDHFVLHYDEILTLNIRYIKFDPA